MGEDRENGSREGGGKKEAREERQQPEKDSPAGLSKVMLQVSTQALTGQRACVQGLTDSLKTALRGRRKVQSPLKIMGETLCLL